jgi:hypothetical protein
MKLSKLLVNKFVIEADEISSVDRQPSEKQKYHINVKAHVKYPVKQIDKEHIADEIRYGNHFTLDDLKIHVDHETLKISNFKKQNDFYVFDVEFKGTIKSQKDPLEMDLYFAGARIKQYKIKAEKFSTDYAERWEKTIKEDENPWEKDSPSKGRKMTSQQIKKAKARARRAGRPYPNLIDNMIVIKQAKE